MAHNESTELNQFIKTQIYGFKPFKADDYVFDEDKNDPLFNYQHYPNEPSAVQYRRFSEDGIHSTCK
jgi:hypothetical protein